MIDVQSEVSISTISKSFPLARLAELREAERAFRPESKRARADRGFLREEHWTAVVDYLSSLQVGNEG